MAAPTKLPVWATDAGTTVEPTTGKKAAGWTVTEKPPARWFNWWMNLVYQWFAYAFNATDGNIQFTNSVTNKPAINVTGNGTAAGVVGTGGSTSGVGVSGVGGATNGYGVAGQGTGSGRGVSGIGGATDGAIGVYGTAGGTTGSLGTTTPSSSGSVGVFGVGRNDGVGVEGQGGGNNGSGGRFEGNGGGYGVIGVGGSSNGRGGNFFGAGSGIGCYGSGGSTNGSIGVYGTSTATNGQGGVFLGTGTGIALEAQKGSGATDAIKADGFIDLSTASNPSASTGFTERLTPMNIPKAWAKLTCGVTAPTVNAGFNVTNPQYSGNNVTLDLVDDLASSTGCAIAVISSVGGNLIAYPAITAAGTVTISALYGTTGGAINLNNSGETIQLLVFGAQ